MIEGVTTAGVGYGMTSLSEKGADAARILAPTRMHWRIEDGPHYVRDVTRGEDAGRVRKGNAPQVAALRNPVIFVVAREVDPTGGQGRMAARPTEAPPGSRSTPARIKE